MEIVQVKIEDLKPAEYNPRKITEKQKKDIQESIKRFGLVEPIIVNGAKERFNVIIGGHQRYYICKEMGHTEMPVVYVNIPDVKKEQELNVRLNKNVGEWDFDMLANIEEEILNLVGFESEELDKIFNLGGGDDFDVDKKYAEITEPKTKKGDIYQLGYHRIICGDAKNADDIKRLMDKEYASLVFTSPPYNMAGNMYQGYHDDLESEEYINFNLSVIDNIKKHLKGFIFWNISYNKNARSEFIDIIYQISKQVGLQFLELIVWDKGHALPITSREGLTRQYEDILLVGDEENVSRDLEFYFLGRNNKKVYFNKRTNKGITNYWKIGTNNTQIKSNLACFPVALPTRGMELMTQRNDIVLDPFLGSGTTLIAAENTGRRCYGIEMDPKLVDLVVERWEEQTKKQAIKL